MGDSGVPRVGSRISSAVRLSLSAMTTFVAVFAMLMAYVALVAAFLALRTLARLRRATAILTKGGESNETMIEATQRHIELTELVAAQNGALRAYVDSMRGELTSKVQLTHRDLVKRVEAIDAAYALRNVALVRYDAFNAMSGRMSFSVAMLDDGGDGITLSAIAGATDTRVYAKGVLGWLGESELTPEEKQAVKAAMRESRARRRTARPSQDESDPELVEGADDHDELTKATSAS